MSLLKIRKNLFSLFLLLCFFCSIGDMILKGFGLSFGWTLYSYTRYIMSTLSVITIVLNLKQKKPFIFWMILVFLLWEILVSLFSGIYMDVSDWSDMITWPLIFLSFILFGNKKQINNSKQQDDFIINTIWICPILIFLYIFSIPLIQKHLNGQGQLGAVIFPTYYCITYLVILLVTIKTKMKWVFIVSSVLVILASTKRAGFLALIIGIMVYLLLDMLIQTTSRKKIRKFVFISIIVISSIILFNNILSSMNITTFERISAIAEDNGSDRTLIWDRIIQSYLRSNLDMQLFGHGFHAVEQINIYSTLAHNDYLEILYDFGIIGIVIYIIIQINMIIFLIKSVIKKRVYAPALGFAMVLVLFFSLVSFFGDESRLINIIVLTWGYCIGFENKIDIKTTSSKKEYVK